MTSNYVMWADDPRRGLLTRLHQHAVELWLDYSIERLGCAFLPEERPRAEGEPRVWIANGWNGSGGGAGGRIGKRELVADWSIPLRWQWLPFVKADDWWPEWLPRSTNDETQEVIDAN